ncbi:hypothetical protein BDV3_003791 [Batrachochytrium dendrobatidis]
MDNDLIRQKRLAKLGGAGNKPTGAGSKPASANSSPINTNIQPTGKSTSVSMSASVDAVGGLSDARSRFASAPTTPAVTTTPVATKSSTLAEIAVNTQSTALDNFLNLTNEDWLDRSLGSILQISLKTPAPNGLMYLQEVVDELKGESIPLVFTTDMIERVIYVRLQIPANSDPTMPALFDYLCGVWTRANSTRQTLKQFLALATENPTAASKACVCDTAIALLQSLAVNYAGLVLNPDMLDNFPLNHDWGSGFLGYKLLESHDPTSVYPREFITEFITRFEDDGLEDILGYTIKSVVTSMRTKSIIKQYIQPIRVFQYLVSFKPIANLVTQLSDWNPDFVNARTVEVMSILGPFLSRTGIFPDSDPEIAAKYFSSSNPFGEDMTDQRGNSIGARNNADVKTAMNGLRDASQLVHTDLFNIVIAIIKAGPTSRECVLAFISHVVKLNISRGKLQVDRRQVSTDGFMHNLLHVCLRLCDPIMDARFSKIALIDLNYPTYTTRLDFNDVTRILVDKDAVDVHVDQWKATHNSETNPQPPVNFVTDIFYLTLAMHHYGVLSTIRYYSGFIKELNEMRKQANKYKAVRDSGAWNLLQPFVRNANEEGLRRLQNEVDKLVGVKLTMDAGLMSPSALDYTLRLYNLTMMVLIRAASGMTETTCSVAWDQVACGNIDGVQLFPLPATPPIEFAVLPEWIIEDICEFYLFIMNNNPVILENRICDEIITFSMVFLSNPNYIRNPYLKSKLVEILFYFTIPLYRTSNGETRGRMDGVFSTHTLARAHLVRSTLGFYVDVEQTGMHSQFYDKFNIRYNISQIIKSVWTDPVHRTALVQASRDKDFFVKFVALLMNDTTYLLDEGLSKLKEIGGLQTELAVPLPENSSDEDKQRRKEREGLLAQHERQALSYVSLSNETVHMLQYMTSHSDIIEPFMATEIVERLAAMLDFNLVALAGPRCTELKVTNPEKYRFDPKRLLSDLVGIFVHLAHRTEFVAAVAKDGRSYSKEVFDRASSILSRHRLLNEMDIAKLNEFVGKVEQTLLADKIEEEEMGDVPDHFLDPLLYTLMEDPVILPSSGVTIDLSTIKSHLLSDAHDPFNRQPLSIDQVKPDVELKEQIQKWKQEKQTYRKTGNSPSMDTSL